MSQLIQPMFSDILGIVSPLSDSVRLYDERLINNDSGCLAASSSELISPLSCTQLNRFVCKQGIRAIAVPIVLVFTRYVQ